jgi:hypothetical protein
MKGEKCNAMNDNRLQFHYFLFVVGWRLAVNAVSFENQKSCYAKMRRSLEVQSQQRALEEPLIC